MLKEEFKVGDVVVPDYEGTGLVALAEVSKSYVKDTLAKTSDGQMVITDVTEALYLAYKCEYYREVDTATGEPMWDHMYFEANELKKIG